MLYGIPNPTIVDWVMVEIRDAAMHLVQVLKQKPEDKLLS